MSLWIDLYPTISADVRFTNIVGQPGELTLTFKHTCIQASLKEMR